MNPGLPTSAIPQGEPLPLRDIVLPPPVGWWPPATGWWLVATFLLVLLAWSAWYWRRHRKRMQLLKPARQTLQQIERRFARHSDSRLLVQELSTLLRQVALSLAPREQVAGLVGKPWLAWLDNCLEDAPFSNGIGRVFAAQAYALEVQVNSDALIKLCGRWLTACADGPTRGKR